MVHSYSWEEETLIIDLYSRTPNSKINNKNEEIISLSEYLKSHGYDCNESGIRNKMENLKSVDDEYTSNARVGRTHIGKNFKNRWNAYQEKGFVGLDEDVQKATSMIDAHAHPPDVRPIQYPSRNGQDIFRNRVLTAYGSTCCITKLDNAHILDACHIKPYRVCVEENRMDQAVDVHNGLCMNPLYHRAFDAGLVGIDEDYCVMLSPHFKLAEDDTLFRPYEGKRIQQSDRVEAGQDYLEYHRKTIFKETAD